MHTLGDVITVGLAIIALIVVPYKLAKAWLWPGIKARFVNSSEDSAPVVMSRSEFRPSPSMPSSLQTDSAKVSDRRMIPAPTQNEMLDIYRLMREHNIPREKARPVLKAAGLPLDNNLWTQAAPPEPEAEEYVTPIAGRPTPAQFKYPDEPELNYQPPN